MLLWFTAIFAVAAVVVASAYAQQVDQKKVAKIKSAYLLNFAKFTKWPDAAFEDDNSPITLAVVGTDELGDALDDTFESKLVHGRSVEIKRMRLPERSAFNDTNSFDEAISSLIDDVKRCHILYLPESVKTNQAFLAALPPTEDLLTVGDSPEFLEFDVLLAFDLHDRRIVFHAHLERARLSRLQISSKLLKLAKPYDSN